MYPDHHFFPSSIGGAKSPNTSTIDLPAMYASALVAMATGPSPRQHTLEKKRNHRTNVSL